MLQMGNGVTFDLQGDAITEDWVMSLGAHERQREASAGLEVRYGLLV